MTDLRTAAQQALEAMRCAVPTGGITLADWMKANHTLRAALAEPVLQTCNCRWDGEMQVQQCTLHESHVDAIKEWAQRAKFAEKKLAALAEPVQEPVAWRWGYRSITTGEMDWRGYVEIAADPNLRSPAIIMQPLYTAPPQRPAEPVQEPQCNPHPKAPHGFLRNASHTEDRYVCECEGWEPYEAGYQAGMEAALRAQS